MPVLPPERLDHHIIKQWYTLERQKRGPVREWLAANPKALRGIEKFCNRLLQKRTDEAVEKAVLARSMEVKVQIRLDKAAAEFYGKVPPQAREGISMEMVQIAIEMLFEQAGYPMNGNLLEAEFEVPSPRELEAMRSAEAERQASAKAKVAAAKRQMTGSRAPVVPVDDDPVDPADDDGEPIDDDGELIDDDGEPIDDESVDDDDDDDEDDEGDDGLEVGQIHGNGKGGLRRIDALNDEDVTWTAVKLDGDSFKEGKTSTTSISSFDRWSQEIIELEAVPA